MQLSNKKKQAKYHYDQGKHLLPYAPQNRRKRLLFCKHSCLLLSASLYVRAIEFNDKSKMLVGEIGFDYHIMVTFNCSHLTPDEMPRCRSLLEHLTAP